MKAFRLVTVLGLFLVAASAAYADGIVDPRIVIDGDTASHGVQSAFTFASDQNGGGFYGASNETGFFNDSGVDWTSLLITAPIPNAGTGGLYIIQSNLFLHATISFSDNTLSILFWGTGFADGGDSFSSEFCAPGIKAGAHFSIDLNDLTGTDGGGWLSTTGSPLVFQAQANVPEPGSFVLLLGGLGVLAIGLARRKR